MAKKLSPAMFNWAKANMSKLKNPTAAQKKIFEQYKAMVKAGDTPANPKPRPKAAPKAKPAAPKPRQTTRKEAEARFYSSSSQGSIAKNQEKAKRNFFRSSSGTRGQLRPSNSPGPAVRRAGSTTGASVDPRERQLRKNRQEAARRRLRGNTNRRGRRS